MITRRSSRSTLFLSASPFDCESRLSMLAVKVRLRKLDLIELGEGSSSPRKAEVYSDPAFLYILQPIAEDRLKKCILIVEFIFCG